MTCDCAQDLRAAAEAALTEADKLHRNPGTRANAENLRRTAMGYAKAAGYLNDRGRRAGA